MSEDKQEILVYNIWRIVRIILIFIVLLIIGAAIFLYFHIKSESHMALRDAKNARMAIETVGIQYYAGGRSVYSPNTRDGLSAGVLERVERLADSNGDICLLSYDQAENKVREMTYREGKYLITLQIGTDYADVWKLEYILFLDLL